MLIKLRSRLRQFGNSSLGQASLWTASSMATAILGAIACYWAQPVLAWASIDSGTTQADASVAKLDELLMLARQSNTNDAAFIGALEGAVNEAKGALTSLDQNVRLLRQQDMARDGYSLAADFFLTKGQAARIGDGSSMIGVRSESRHSTAVRVSLNEKEVVANPGQRVKFQSGGKNCYVTYVGKAQDNDSFGFVTGCGMDESNKPA